MLDVGFDEGGDKDTLLVSLQFGATRSLARLERNWKPLIDKAGIPFFHSKDFHNKRRGVFRNLGIAERGRLLKSLARLVHHHLEGGLTVELDLKRYEVEANSEFKSKWGGSAYALAVQMAAVGLSEYMREHNRSDEEVNIIVASGHRNLKQALEMVKGLQVDERFLKIHTLSEGDMPDFGILQAADMLAYGEWQNKRRAPEDIYHALHRKDPKYRYWPGYVVAPQDSVQTMSGAVEEFKAACKRAAFSGGI